MLFRQRPSMQYAANMVEFLFDKVVRIDDLTQTITCRYVSISARGRFEAAPISVPVPTRRQARPLVPRIPCLGLTTPKYYNAVGRLDSTSTNIVTILQYYKTRKWSGVVRGGPGATQTTMLNIFRLFTGVVRVVRVV